MVIKSSDSPSAAIVVMDASIKNDITTSILHMHTFNSPLIKTLYHTVFVTSTEAELFAIRCGINQASNWEDISKIIIVTDSIHVAKKIFDPSLHLYQIHAVAILNKLHKFFIRNQNNLIKFWECPSWLNWSLHKVVDKDSKAFNSSPVFLCKISWDFSRKTKCDDIINNWKMIFQASDLKGRQFLDLLDKDFNIIKPCYTKKGSWLKLFGHLNSLYACATRAITNHAPIGEYRLRFFPREKFKCLCGLYPIESRQHILHECRRFNGYWNPRQDSLNHFVMFLEANPNAFTFNDNSFSTVMSRSYN